MRKVLIALAAFVVVIAGAALTAGAGTPTTYMVTIDPTEGETGTLITFTPTDLCPSINTGAAANAPGDYYAAVSRMEEPSSPSDYLADTLVDDEGDWTLTYEVPSDEPAGEITFYAFCLYEQWPDLVDGAAAAVPDSSFVTASYEPVVFTVTAPPVTTTTTTTVSTTSTTASGAPLPKLVASPTSVFPGDTIAVNASGFKPGTDVVITLESDPVNLGTYVADSAGRIATNIVVPTDFPAGNHTIKLTGTDIGSAVLVLTTGITVGSRIQVVTTTAAPAATSTLPQTGSPVTEPALLIGGALVLAGAGALVAARRRRSAAR